MQKSRKKKNVSLPNKKVLYKPFDPLTEFENAVKYIEEYQNRRGDINGYTIEEIKQLRKEWDVNNKWLE